MADKMKDEFDKTAQMFKTQNMPKRLVKDNVFVTEFEANGKKYKVMKPNEVFNISRATAYTNIKIAFDLCQTPTQIKQRFYHLYQLCTPSPSPIFEHCNKKNQKINTILVYFFNTKYSSL